MGVINAAVGEGRKIRFRLVGGNRDRPPSYPGGGRRGIRF